MKKESIKYAVGFSLTLLLSSCGDDKSKNESMNSNTKAAVESVEKNFESLFPWATDKKLALEKLKESTSAYSKLSPELQKDKEVVEVALKHKMPFYMLNENLAKDKDITLIALKYDPSEYSSVDESLKSDSDIILAALKTPYAGTKKIFKHVSAKLKSDPNFMLQVLAIKSDDQRMNGDFFIDPHSTFEPTLGDLSQDKNFIEKAVTIYGSILCELDDSFKNDRELVLKAVKQYGRTVACISKELKKDREIILTAVMQDGTALLMGIDAKFRDDKEIVLAAIKQAGPHVLVGASSPLQKDKDVIKLIKEKMAK